VHIGFVADAPGFEHNAFLFEAYRRGLHVGTTTMARESSLPYMDILIGKTGDLGWPPSVRALEVTLAALAEPDSEFHRMPRTFPLPDGSEAFVYVRR
jgi:hypothetical protein